MYCNQCNRENPDDSRFCEFCGAELKPPAKEPKQAFSRKKLLAIVIGVLVLIGAAVAVALYINYGQHGEYHQQIRTGDQYLKEQEYDKAETAYLNAIKLEPKQEKGYIKAADLYIKQKNYEEAEKILTSGEQTAGGSKIKKKLKQVQKLKESAVSELWAFFLKKNMLFKTKAEIEDVYGMLSLRNEGEFQIWQDFTWFNPSFWFAKEGDPVFSLDESSEEVCDGMAGTAEELFGLTEEQTMQEFEKNMDMDEKFQIYCTTDVLMNGWVGEKKIDGKLCEIYVCPDDLKMVWYKYEYDFLGGLGEDEDIPEVGVSDLSKYMEAYDEDPSKISPDTPVIIIYPESDYYKNFFS